MSANQIPTLGYWFGNQYFGPQHERMQFNMGLIEDICRQNFLPPVVLASEIAYPQTHGKNPPLVTVDLLKQIGEDEVPVGWMIKVKGDKVLADVKDDALYIKKLDSILKRTLFRVAWYEALDLRLHQGGQLSELTQRGLRQVAAVLGAYIAAVGIENPIAQLLCAEFGFALIQNYIGLPRDLSQPKYSDDYEIDRNTRNTVELWRRSHFPKRYQREGIGPGIAKNIFIHSIPMAEMGEPLFRFAASVAELKHPLIRLRQ